VGQFEAKVWSLFEEFAIMLSRTFFIFITLICVDVKAQNFNLLKTFGTPYSQVTINNICTEPNGGCAVLLNYDNSSSTGSVPDTLKLGNFQYVKTKGANFVNFLVRLDSLGKVLKVRLINKGTLLTNLCRDEYGNYFIAGTVNSTAPFDSLMLDKANGGLVLVKYDKDLKLKWIKQTGSSSTSYKELVYSQGHLLFICTTSNPSKFGSDTFNFVNSTNYVFGEIDKSNGNIIWSNNLYRSSSSSYNARLTGIQYLNGRNFLIGECDNGLKISSDTFYQGGFLVQTDSTGNYLKRIAIHSSRWPKFGCITTDGEYLYVSAEGEDSFYLDDKTIYTQYSYGTGKLEFLVASFTSSLKLRWYFQPLVLDKSKATGRPTLSISNEGYLYFGGYLYTKIKLGTNILEPAGAGYDIMFFKMDYIGNVLWATSGQADNAQMLGLDAIAGKYVYSGGYFNKDIQFGSLKETHIGLKDGWVCKINDNSIFRGNIKTGPYCAGDTIKVPYTKFGNFDTSNYFIAELSDEDGNFDTISRELARIKSSKDGIITGKLPLFKVSTSNRYRIRIRSTSPVLQSFYRIDTLRLLIYSKDRSEPGPPQAICQGDSIRLRSLGGSKWIWSPNYNMDDNTKRQPIVWPEKDTVYRIIISDSHGCGKPDTAFKRIFVRPYPKAILVLDTMVCDNSPMGIPVRFEGGDSNYHWNWYFVTDKKWFKMVENAHGFSDTLFYVPSVDFKTSEKLAIILKDECTSKADTAYIAISRRTSVELKTKLRDTIVCFNNEITLKVNASGGLPNAYHWQWKDITHNAILSKTDSLGLTAKQTSKIELTVNDGCLALGDTQQFTVFVNPPLKASILVNNRELGDTTLCFKQSLKLFSLGKGGAGTGYTFKWYLDKTLLSTNDTFILNTQLYYPNTTKIRTLNLVLKDNCTKDADSVTKNIKVIESPIADYIVGSTCNLKPINFTFNGTKPVSPVITTFKWDFAGEGSSNLENPNQKISVGKRKVTLSVTASNGCKDTMTKELNIKAQALANFEALDVCEDSHAVFKNKSTVTSGKLNYRWYFGDGKTSATDTPIHIYQIGGVTKTFNVKLSANVPNGCSDSITKAITINAIPKKGFKYNTSGQTVNFIAVETNATQFQWTFGDGGTFNTINPKTSYSYSKFPSGKYKACLHTINLAGCSSDSCIEINISGGIGTLSKFKGIQIYPNPNNGSFTIEIAEPEEEMNLEINNPLGQVIYRAILNQSITKLNLSSIRYDIANGVYLVRITVGENIYNQRIIVNR
jgi:hypothetical protein